MINFLVRKLEKNKNTEADMFYGQGPSEKNLQKERKVAKKIFFWLLTAGLTGLFLSIFPGSPLEYISKFIGILCTTLAVLLFFYLMQLYSDISFKEFLIELSK